MKAKLSQREREKQWQVLMRGVAAADQRLRIADAACAEMEQREAAALRTARSTRNALVFVSGMALLSIAFQALSWFGVRPW